MQFLGFVLTCEQALQSRMGRRGKREKTVKRGRGLRGRQGEGEEREPVDKGLKPPFRPLVIDLSLICHQHVMSCHVMSCQHVRELKQRRRQRQLKCQLKK